MKNKEVTLEESEKILLPLVDKEDFMNFKNHRKHDLKENMYRFTDDIMSLELLISIIEHPKVKNVYFNPSVPPPGGEFDGISMRYKVYVEYHYS